MSDLATALIAELDDAALDLLADRLVPCLANKLAPARPTEDGWLTTRQAAEHLGLSTHALHRLTAERSIPFEQEGPGCKCWFRRSELDTWRQGIWRRNGAVAPAHASKTLPNRPIRAMAPGVRPKKNPA